jgi:hypothetical protein
VALAQGEEQRAKLQNEIEQLKLVVKERDRLRQDLYEEARVVALGRRVALSSVAAVMVVPLVHIAAETVRIAGRGDLVYNTEVDGGSGALRGFRDLIGQIDENITLLAMIVIVGALAAVVVVFFVTRALNWLAMGAMLSGIFALFFAGQAGVVVSRYYMPTLALFAVAFSIAFGAFGSRIRIVAILAVLVAALPYGAVGRDRVGNWADTERVVLYLVGVGEATGGQRGNDPPPAMTAPDWCTSRAPLAPVRPPWRGRD